MNFKSIIEKLNGRLGAVVWWVLVAVIAFSIKLIVDNKSLVEYTPSSAVASREVCPGETIRADIVMQVHQPGIYVNAWDIRDDASFIIVEAGNLLPIIITEEIVGVDIYKEFVITVPEIPPGEYTWINSSISLSNRSPSDALQIGFVVAEGCE